MRNRNSARGGWLPLVLTCVFVSSLVSGCSDAKTPDAYFANTVIAADGGNAGLRDFPCRDGNSCIDGLDTCIRDSDGLNYCRRQCDTNSPPNGGCEDTHECRGIIDTDDGVCVPVGPLGEVDDDCPCATGLRCVRFDGVDGGPEDRRCRTECEVVDGGLGQCPVDEGRCVLFDNSTTIGACIE